MPKQDKDSTKSLTAEEYDSLGLEDSIKYIDDINQQLWHLNTAKQPNDNALSASADKDTEEDYISYEDINLSKVSPFFLPTRLRYFIELPNMNPSP